MKEDQPNPFDEFYHVQHNGVWYVRLRLGWRKKVDGELCPLEVGEQERMISAVRAKGKVRLFVG